MYAYICLYFYVFVYLLQKAKCCIFYSHYSLKFSATPHPILLPSATAIFFCPSFWSSVSALKIFGIEKWERELGVSCWSELGVYREIISFSIYTFILYKKISGLCSKITFESQITFYDVDFCSKRILTACIPLAAWLL